MKLPRNAQIWLPGWLAARRRNAVHRFSATGHVTVWLFFTDHFEPRWARPDESVARSRVDAWRTGWPRVAGELRDDFGRPPRWTFFYPEEEYHPALLAPLAELGRLGIGDVEVHLHHDGEGEADFVQRIERFVATLSRDHGLLHQVDGRTGFGFIHGNWALDNARPDGRWCGLNNELTLLRRLGCYADFTLPAAPDPSQTHLVNAIYWAVDDPARPRSHDTGTLVTPGATPPDHALLCVQGPLAVGIHPHRPPLPTLDVGELAAYAPPSPVRARRWLDAAPRVGNDVFVKLFTHGAIERNAGPLLGGFVAQAIGDVHAECRRRGWRLAFASAYEAWLAIQRAAGLEVTAAGSLPG